MAYDFAYTMDGMKFLSLHSITQSSLDRLVFARSPGQCESRQSSTSLPQRVAWPVGLRHGWVYASRSHRYMEPSISSLPGFKRADKVDE